MDWVEALGHVERAATAYKLAKQRAETYRDSKHTDAVVQAAGKLLDAAMLLPLDGTEIVEEE